MQEAFEEFASARDSETKRNLVSAVLNDLKVHAAIEEEIFYPAVRQTIAADSIINLAIENIISRRSSSLNWRRWSLLMNAMMQSFSF